MALFNLRNKQKFDGAQSLQCREGDKDQEQIQSSAIPNLEYHMGSGKNTTHKRGQEVSPFLECDHKAARNSTLSWVGRQRERETDMQHSRRLHCSLEDIFARSQRALYMQFPRHIL